MSRAQMEIFGLVIIVILVALGLLFAVMVLTKTQRSEVSRVKESIQAANFIHTILGTTSDNCGKRTLRQLLQDCALASVDSSGWLGATSCQDGMTTCQKLNLTLARILPQTIGLGGKNYKLFMNNSQALERIRLEQGTCTGEREGSTRPEIVRPGFYVNVTLQICQS